MQPLYPTPSPIPTSWCNNTFLSLWSRKSVAPNNSLCNISTAPNPTAHPRVLTAMYSISRVGSFCLAITQLPIEKKKPSSGKTYHTITSPYCTAYQNTLLTNPKITLHLSMLSDLVRDLLLLRWILTSSDRCIPYCLCWCIYSINKIVCSNSTTNSAPQIPRKDGHFSPMRQKKWQENTYHAQQ